MTKLTNFNENYVVSGLQYDLSTELSTEIVSNSVKVLVVRELGAISSVISVLRCWFIQFLLNGIAKACFT